MDVKEKEYYDEYRNGYYNPDDDNKEPGLNENWKAVQEGFSKVQGKDDEQDDRLDDLEESAGAALWEAGTGTAAVKMKNATAASGANAIAEGAETTASGVQAHAEGADTTASGMNAHAEGADTTASGAQAHAEGYQTTAEGPLSHTEGNGTRTTAPATGAHAEGTQSIASFVWAHAEGDTTTAQGSASHAEGLGTIASGSGTHAFGSFNEDLNSTAQPYEKGTYVEIVGNGTSGMNRSNARVLDWTGNEKIAGSLTLGMGTANEVTLTPAQLTALLALLNN